MHHSSPKILKGNIFQLDVLRGLAVLLVMAFHFIKGFSFGWIGVDLFFVLSGFLITGKLVESIGTSRYYISYYIKRVLRIVPLYYGVLFIFFILLPVFATSYVTSSIQGLLNDQVYYWTFSTNFIEAIKGWPTNITLIHFWSLACEMQFYLVWPFVIRWVVVKKERQIIFFLLILLALFFRLFIAEQLSLHFVGKYVLLPSRIDAFATGSILYFYISNGAKGRWLVISSIALATLAVVSTICLAYGLNWHYSEEPVQLFGYTLNALFWGCIVALTYFYLSNKSILAKCLVIAGKYSYAMYVFHLPVWVLLNKYNEENFIIGPSAVALLAFGLTFGLSYVSFHFYEKHFLMMKPR